MVATLPDAVLRSPKFQVYEEILAPAGAVAFAVKVKVSDAVLTAATLTDVAPRTMGAVLAMEMFLVAAATLLPTRSFAWRSTV